MAHVIVLCLLAWPVSVSCIRQIHWWCRPFLWPPVCR